MISSHCKSRRTQATAKAHKKRPDLGCTHQKGARIFDMRNIIRVAEPAVAAVLLRRIRAAWSHGLGLLAPIDGGRGAAGGGTSACGPLRLVRLRASCARQPRGRQQQYHSLCMSARRGAVVPTMVEVKINHQLIKS